VSWIFVGLEHLLDMHRSDTSRTQSVGKRLSRQLPVDRTTDDLIIRLRRWIESRE